MKTGVIYARYSSDKQTEQSIEGQVHVCEAYAKQNGILILDTYIDQAVTGTNDNRAAFQQMLKDSDKKQWDYVLVYKLDRFSRNKYEITIHRKHLKDNGIKILSAMEQIPETPEGTLLESLLEGMNQYYSEELSQKTKRGMNESRLKGLYVGGPVPLGYFLQPIYEDRNGKQVRVAYRIAVNEDEAYLVREIFDRYVHGEDVKDIVADYRKRNILCKGKDFKPATIYNILSHDFYTGVYKLNNIEYTNYYPQILSSEVFTAAAEKLKINNLGKNSIKVPYLLRGKVFCGICGHKMSAHSQLIWRYYACRNHCGVKHIRKEKLEYAVIQALRKLTKSPKMINLLVQKYTERQKLLSVENKALNAFQNELTNIRKSIANIIKAIEMGIITASTKERLDELERRQAELLMQINAERDTSRQILSEENIQEYISRALNALPQQLIDLLVDKVIVYNDKIDIILKYGAKPADTPKYKIKCNTKQPDTYDTRAVELLV